MSPHADLPLNSPRSALYSDHAPHRNFSGLAVVQTDAPRIVVDGSRVGGPADARRPRWKIPRGLLVRPAPRRASEGALAFARSSGVHGAAGLAGAGGRPGAGWPGAGRAAGRARAGPGC